MHSCSAHGDSAADTSGHTVTTDQPAPRNTGTCRYMLSSRDLVALARNDRLVSVRHLGSPRTSSLRHTEVMH